MRRYKLAPLAAAIALSTITQVQAQEGYALEEVVVTATKRETSLQDTPVTVNAYDSQRIQDSGIATSEDVAIQTPSLTVSPNTNPFTARIQIRGIGTAQTDPALEPSVGLFIDGVYLGRSGLGMSDLTDIERIEVLQGPQGTLYGKNTNAGAISITTKGPNTEEFEGFVETTFGDFNQRKITAAISGPLSDTVAFRLSGNMNKKDGYFDNASGDDHNGADDWNLLAKVLWEPTDDLSIQFNASYVERDANCCGSDMLQSDAFLALMDDRGVNVIPNDSSDHEVSTSVTSEFKLKAEAASIVVDYDKDWGNIKSITTYDDFEYTTSYDADQSQLDVLAIVDDLHFGDSFSQEFRFTSNSDGDIDYQAGLFYYESTVNRGEPGRPYGSVGTDFIDSVAYNTLYAGGVTVDNPAFYAAALPNARNNVGLLVQPGDNVTIDNQWNSETIAVFGQATWHATDRLHLTAGLRWTDEEKDADLFGEAISTAPVAGIDITQTLVYGITTPIDAKLKRRSINKDWMLNASFDLTEDTMIFASASTGTKSGGFNGVNGEVDEREFDDELTRSYELGIKTTLLEERLRINATAFITEISDYQSAEQLPSGAGFAVVNEGELTIEGLDLNIDALPLPNLMLNAGLMYLNKREFTEGANEGLTKSWTAEVSGNLGAMIFLPVGEGTAYARIDYSFMGDHTTGRDWQEQDMENWNINMGWRNDNLNVSVWGKNLTDFEYAGTQAETLAFTGGLAEFLMPPRTIGATVRYDF